MEEGYRMTTWIRHVGSLIDPTVARVHAGDHYRDTVSPVRGARQTRTVRYEVMIDGRGDEELALLGRAIGRLRKTGRLVTAVEATRDGDGITITIALRRPGRRAVREAERVLALLWYDAFGVREVAHTGRLID
jgi:hypothetical protein